MKKTKKVKGRPDEDLFGNTDDIFSSVPDSVPKKTTTKKKKKTGATGDGEATAGELKGGEYVWGVVWHSTLLTSKVRTKRLVPIRPLCGGSSGLGML